MSRWWPPAPAVAPAPATRVASVAPSAQSDGFFSSLARKVGFGASADTTATAPPPPAAAPAKPKAIEAKRGPQNREHAEACRDQAGRCQARR